MIVKGIRGATTVDSNKEDSLKNATLELLSELVAKNNIDKNLISHVIFTLTSDINCAFPAKFARLDFGWDNVAMMCFNELKVTGSLEMALRVLIVYNCDEKFKPEYVYLKGAKNLRK